MQARRARRKGAPDGGWKQEMSWGQGAGNCGRDPSGDTSLCSYYNYILPPVKLQIIKIQSMKTPSTFPTVCLLRSTARNRPALCSRSKSNRIPSPPDSFFLLKYRKMENCCRNLRRVRSKISSNNRGGINAVGYRGLGV